MAKVPIDSFVGMGDPELGELVELFAESLYYELGGLGPIADAHVAAASVPATSSGGGPSTVAASAQFRSARGKVRATSDGFVKLLPAGRRGKLHPHNKIPKRETLRFDENLKAYLLTQYRSAFEEIVFSKGAPPGLNKQELMEALEEIFCPACSKDREAFSMHREHAVAFAIIRKNISGFLLF